MSTQTPWDDVRFRAQVTADYRLTLLCPPSLIDKVRAKLAELGMDGLHDVDESPFVPDGQIFVLDHNAVEAATRQAIQRVAKRRIW
jgi:hypothetical protein